MSVTKKGLETADLLLQHSKKATKKYLILLFFGIALAFVPFLIMTWIGVETSSRWLIMMGGLWRVVFGIGVAIIFSILAIPILLLTKGREGPDIYMRTVLGAVLVALSTSLILMITPLTSNPQNIPIFLMCLIIGGIILTVKSSIRPIAWLVGIVFILTFLSFFLPNKFSQARRAIEEFDQGLAGRPKLPHVRQIIPVPLPKTDDYNKSHLEQGRSLPPASGDSETQTPIAPMHDIAVIITGAPDVTEQIASYMKSKGNDVITVSSSDNNIYQQAKYLIKGKKSVKFGTDRVLRHTEAEVIFDIQMVDTQNGNVVKSFRILKTLIGLSRESAERNATQAAMDEIYSNLS
jgi:hypothetical protein